MINICYSFCIKVCLSVSLKYIFFCLVGWFLCFFFSVWELTSISSVLLKKKKKAMETRNTSTMLHQSMDHGKACHQFIFK